MRRHAHKDTEFINCVILVVFIFSLIGEISAAAPPPGKPRYRPPKKPVVVKKRYMRMPLSKRPSAPGKKYIWVPRYAHPSGKLIGGYWRPPCKKGFVWVKDSLNVLGDMSLGHCRPIKPVKGKVWIPGYWKEGKWTAGFWRVQTKPGSIWMPGHFNKKGIWVPGRWKGH
jgi:hypothetical protein